MATFYVDNTLHPAANAVGTATAGGADYILLDDAGTQADDEFNGYGILITGGTGAGQQRRIVDYDHTGHPSGERWAMVDSAWATNPDATSTYEITVGCDGNSGASEGGGSGGAWRTIDRAMNAIAGAGGGGHRIYVKDGRAYLETATVDTAGQTGGPVIVEGYGSTPGDGGMATVDGGGVRSSGITSSISGGIYHVFRNLRATHCTASGFDMPTTQTVRFINCVSENNGANGFNMGQDNLVLGCEAIGNGGHGFICVSSSTFFGTVFVHCRSRGNGNQQYKGGSILLVFCTASGLANNKQAVAAPVTPDGAILINCAIDGTGSTGATGYYMSLGVRQMAINCIFSNLNRGIQAVSTDLNRFGRNNLFFNCSAGDMTNFVSDGGDVLADPGFVDAAAGDFRLAVGSPALRAGWPGHLDIGAAQHPSRNMIGGPCQVGVQG
ncbi:MAG: hypothetical protein HY718_11745 [Planctomycetes bacterium]|nr:hypothetical protein [Planctomycetota bacterium]